MIRDSFIKLGRETKSPFITNPFRFAGVQWATALTNWLKRKPLTINGAAKTPTLDDDFSGTDNWTDTGTDFAVNTTTDVIDWNSNEGNVTHLTYYDLGAGAVSDENWVIRYPLNIANISDGTVTASAQFYGGISDSTTGFGATQNGVFFTIRRSTVTDDYSIFATENETVSTDGGEQFTRTPTAETVYVEIIRKNDSITINQYSDSNYSVLLESLTRTTGISAITGLRYLIFFNRDNSATINATLNGTINEVSFWNGVTTVENIPSQQTATFSDDFSGTDNWTDSDSAIIGVNTTTDVMDVTERATVGDEVTYKTFTALGTDANFVYRTEFGITAFTQSATVEMLRTTIGLSSANDIAQTTTRDEVGITWQLGNSGGINKFYCFTADAAQLPTSGTDFTTITPTASTTYYMEIIGNGGTYTFNIYSDSNYSVLLETKTITDAGITGLDNMVVRSTAFTTHNQTLDVAIQQIKRWDNITEVNPTTLTNYPLPIKIIGDTNLQRKTTETLDEDFSVDTNWTASGTSIDIITADNEMTISVPNSTVNHYHSYNMGSDKTIGRLDFDLEFTTLTQGSDPTTKDIMIGFSNTQNHGRVNQTGFGLLARIANSAPTFYASSPNNQNMHDALDYSFASPVEKTYYVTMLLISATDYRIILYADKARTIILDDSGGQTHTNTTLQYFNVSSNNGDGTGNGTLDAKITRLRWWDGITNPVTQETPTLDDDFTSDNFNDTGTKIGVANNTLEWDGAQNGSVHGSTIDLTSIDTKAVFRAKLRINTLTAPSSASNFILIGFSDSDHTTAGDSSQDGIGLIIQNDTGPNSFRAMHVDGAVFSPNAGTAFATVPATATDYFIEVVLDVNTWYVRIYSDSSYSTLIEEETGSLTATGLRYFGIKMRSSVSVNGTFDGYIDDLQFWNGISSPNAEGRKFVFTNDAFDGNAVEYASETTSYDPINGDWTGYVRIPSLATGADTTIQMYYDYSAANPSYVPELFTSMPTADSVFGVNGDQVIEDCTTYANTTEGDADYVPSVTGTNECRLNPSTDVIDCRFEDNSADHFVAYRDLTGTTITDNAWTLRCKVATTVITAPSGGLSHSVYIGMSDNTSNFATSQDFLGISFWNPGASASPNTPKHYAVYRDSAIGGMSNQAPAASSVVFSTAWTNTDTYYIEIIRVSNTKLTVELFSDSAYTTSVEKQTVSVPSTVTGLRYFKAGVYDNANVVGFTMTIDDLEFWEGVNKNREQSTYDSNYKAVYHLQGNSIDSTAYGNDGTDTSVDWQQQNNSVGLLSSGASTDINVGSDASLDNIFDGGGMISCYINPLSNGEAANARIIDKSTTGWTYRVSNESAGTIDVVFLVETSGTIGRWETTTALTLGELNKVDLYYNSDNVTTAPIFLINGNKVSLTQTSTPTGTRADDSAANMRIGDSNAGGESFDGFIDNVKISDKIRPSSEAITSYNAEKSDSDIITKGDELTQ